MLVLLGWPGARTGAETGGGEARCPPPGTTRESLGDLAHDGFAVEDAAQRDRLAVGLVACLGDPDPALRDGVAFAAASRWLRAGELSPATIRELASRLVGELRSADDPLGFRRPFAALVLSEVVRADRIEAVLEEAERHAVVEVAVSYLRGVDDYRGFDEVGGWRHGVAHGADLALQLGVHPLVTRPEVERLLEAVRQQVAPRAGVFYVYGEPERLARAVYFTHRRGLLDTAWWREWFRKVADPAPLSDWGSAYESQAGLAQRHDTVAFLLAVAFAGRSDGDDTGAALAGLAEEAMGRLLGG